MIYLQFSIKPNCIRCTAYCLTVRDRIFLYGLLAAGFTGTEIYNKPEDVIDNETVEASERPLEFDFIVPVTVEVLIRCLREHEVIFCTSTDKPIKFNRPIGSVRELTPGSLKLGTHFASQRRSATFAAEVQQEYATLRDAGNWIWADQIPSSLKSVTIGGFR